LCARNEHFIFLLIVQVGDAILMTLDYLLLIEYVCTNS